MATYENQVLPLVGRRVTSVSVDPDNSDVLIEFENASFAFLCEYEISPNNLTLNDCIGQMIVAAERLPFSLILRFESGNSLQFTWQGSTCPEAFQGTIWHPDKTKQIIVESSHY